MVISKLIPIFLFFFLLIPIASASTIYLGGDITTFSVDGINRHIVYEGLNDNNLTFLILLQVSGGSQEKFTIR